MPKPLKSFRCHHEVAKVPERSLPYLYILYTSAEINRLYPAPEYLYAVYTSSKSHNCSAGNSNRA